MTMNKEKARQILAAWLVSSKGTEERLGYIEGWFNKEDEEAFLMGIEALNEQPKGKWKYGNGNGECPFCGREKQRGWDNYCGYCGAKMR